MNISYSYTYLAFCASLFSSFAYANESNINYNVNNTLDEIIVSSAKIEQNLYKALPAVTVINLDKEKISNITLAEVLSRQAGIEVRQSGGIGTQTNIFMRSNNSSQVLVLLDGVPLNSLSAGISSIEHIDIANLQKIEIVQGSVSSLYGSGNGGVINLISRAGNVSKVYASIKEGSNHTHGLNLGLNDIITSGNKITKYGIGVNNLYTKGINAMNQSIYPTINPDMDSFNQKGANIYASTQINNQEIGINAAFTDTQGSYDNPYNLNINDSNIYKSNFKNISLYSKNKWSDKLTSKLILGYNQDDVRDYVNSSQTSIFKNTSKFITAQVDYAFMPKNVINFQAEHLSQNLSSNTIYDKNKRNTNSLRVGYNAEFGIHDLQLNLRRDNISNINSKNTYYAGYGININNNWKFIASHSTSFRSPTFNELYYPMFGNPNLKLETSKSYELSMQYKNDSLLWRTNFYNTKYKDLIGYDNSFNLNNINKAKIRGIETLAQYSLGNSKINASLNYQEPYQYDVNASGDESKSILLRRSRVYANLGTNYTFSSTPLDIGANIKLMGKSNDIFFSGFSSNIVKVGGYALIDIYANYNLYKNWKLSLNINNIFNRKNISDIYGYNKPKREAYLQLTYLSK